MYEALKKLQAEAGENAFEIVYSEDMFNVADAREAIRDYADTGFDLVVAHGAQYGTSVQEIAPDFPETAFAWGNGAEFYGLDNVIAFQASAEQGGYVLGQVAAAVSPNGKLGVCGPVESGDAKTFIDGFKYGASAVGAQVSVTYTSSWSDVSLMAAAAETHMDEGATVLTGVGQAVPGAISVVKERNGFWIGVEWDNIPIAPDHVLASLVYDWTPMLVDIIENIDKGILGGKAYDLTFANEGLQIWWNTADLPDVATDALIAMSDSLIDQINSGEITPLPAQ